MTYSACVLLRNFELGEFNRSSDHIAPDWLNDLKCFSALNTFSLFIYLSQHSQALNAWKHFETAGSNSQHVYLPGRLPPLLGILEDVVDQQVALGQDVASPAIVIRLGRFEGMPTVDEDQR